ncbi:DNA polymerase III beta subunit [hydrothermal vent metagenome]|uniref:DNA polymerase III beta subunit n=1 Tax=hydrothermal vent metagenome TaxID=652676 RepID=A0A3B0YZL9_9ZZZZ
MRFSIKQESLLKALLITAGIIDRKQTLPVLANILISINDNKMSLTGTDLELEIVVCADFEEGDDGQVTLPAKKITDICRSLPKDSILEFKISENRVVVRSGRSRFTLATLPAAEYPSLDDIKYDCEFSIPQNVLKALIERTQFAMAQQDVRYYLNGLLLEVSENVVRTVATDGHRLALSEQNIEIDIKENQQVIIPRKGVLELAKLLEDSEENVRVQLGNNHIRVCASNKQFTSKLIDGRFPEYQRVVPQGGDKVVFANAEELKQALIRAAILTNEKYRSIRFQLEFNCLRVLANNPEQEEAEEEVTVDYSGEELDIGFNATYMLEAVNAIQEESVKLTLSDADSCCLVESEANQACRYVVMPMRI